MSTRTIAWIAAFGLLLPGASALGDEGTPDVDGRDRAVQTDPADRAQPPRTHERGERPSRDAREPRGASDRAGGPSSGSYVVREGDTLSGIAEEELGDARQWRAIAKANGLDENDALEVGQRLRIPGAQGMERGARGDRGGEMPGRAERREPTKHDMD